MIFDGNFPATYFTSATNGQLLALNLSSTPACSFYPTDSEVEMGNPQYLDQESFYPNPNYLPLICNALGTVLSCTFNDGSAGVFGIREGGNQVIFTPPADVVNPIQLSLINQC